MATLLLRKEPYKEDSYQYLHFLMGKGRYVILILSDLFIYIYREEKGGVLLRGNIFDALQCSSQNFSQISAENRGKAGTRRIQGSVHNPENIFKFEFAHA